MKHTQDVFVLQTKDLGKTYKGVTALHGLDLQVPRHSIFGFLGPNGSGKSTTIKLLLGLIRPTRGSGTIFGYDIVRDSIAIRKRIGYLAQDPRFYEDLTARETLRFTLRFFSTGPSAAIEKCVGETLELVGLADKADRPVKGFSGGERQRLGIAQAQINQPDLLILDEPAAALDPRGRRDVLEIMQRLQQYTTIFYSTHLLDDVQRVSDMVAILNNGKLVVQAPIATLLTGGDTATFTLRLSGDTRGAYACIASLPWVISLNVVSEGRLTGQTVWDITVNDESTAQAQLLPLLTADTHVNVLEFGHKKHGLEEAFLQLVEGGHNGR